MSYIICLKKNTIATLSYNGEKRVSREEGAPASKYGMTRHFATKQGAAVAAAALNRKAAKGFTDQFKEKNRSSTITKAEWVVMTSEDWNEKYNPMVERTNIQGGGKFMEPKYTPNCCSPASETYHCM